MGGVNSRSLFAMKNRKRREILFEAAQEFKKRAPKEVKGLRIVITGKGGAGKTTITAILAKLIKRDDFGVLAVDGDPQINLPYALGIPPEREIIPLSKNFDYIEEKTGARPGESWGLMLSINPDVRDVVERFGMTTEDGINLLVMGSVVQAATGCLCPENALLDAVVRFISLKEGEVILMDTQAGVEHFGRALARGFKQAVIVTEPTFNAFQVAKHSLELSRGLGIPYVHLIVNKVRSEEDVARLKNIAGKYLHLFDEVFYLPYYEKLLLYEPDISPVLDEDSPYMNEIRRIKEVLLKHRG